MKKILSAFLALILAFGSPPSFAGYAQLKPPSGWSQGMGAAVPGQAGVFSYGMAANGANFKGSTVLTNAALNVAGQLVTVPVSMRVAANAASVAAEWSFGNPWLFVAALAAPLAYNWFAESGFLVKNGAWVKEVAGCTPGPCFEYKVGDTAWYPTVAGAAGAWIAAANASPNGTSTLSLTTIDTVNERFFYDVFDKVSGNFATTGYGSYQFRSISVSSPTFVPVLLPEFLDGMRNRSIPDGMPLQLPDIQWPVQQPVVNPDPSISPLPSPSPAQSPRPLWVPTGDPVKNPNPSPSTQPDTWTQPGQRVTPSPTVSDPWRVDVVPDDKTKTDPSTNVETPVESTPATPEKLDIETCGLPGKPKCLIDETGTPADKAESFNPAETALDVTRQSAQDKIIEAQSIEAPSWSFTFQLPTGCAPYVTGIRGFVMNVCEYQSTIHDLLSMVWAAATAFACIGMVGRTIREA